MLMKFR